MDCTWVRADWGSVPFETQQGTVLAALMRVGPPRRTLDQCIKDPLPVQPNVTLFDPPSACAEPL